MTDDERATIAAIARLRGELAGDRLQLARAIADADEARVRLAQTPDDHAVLALAAVALHGWYTGVETMCERVARQLDRSVPEGQRWHRELLTQMTVEIPRLRPAVLPSTTLSGLADLLAFRHFFRHAYGMVLDRPKIVDRLATLHVIVPPVDEAFDRFDAFLAAATDPQQ